VVMKLQISAYFHLMIIASNNVNNIFLPDSAVIIPGQGYVTCCSTSCKTRLTVLLKISTHLF
jgi:hypothetical protein